MPRRSRAYPIIKSSLRAGDQAMRGIFRWAVTDHAGLGDDFDSTPTHSIGAAVRHIVLHVFQRLWDAALTGIWVYVLIAYVIPHSWDDPAVSAIIVKKSILLGLTMNQKTFSKLVAFSGFLMMVIGFSMDTTVQSGIGRIVNLHLISQQNILIMFGGFMFLGGLVLYSVIRVKQTAEDEAKEEAEIENTIKKRKLLASSFIARIGTHFSNPSDMRLGRLATGLIVGFTLSLVPLAFSSIAAVFVFGGVFWAAHRNIPAANALRPILAINATIYGIIFVFSVASLPSMVRSLNDSFFTLVSVTILAIILITSLLSAVFFWWVGQAE